jgi:hypothetical protein
MQKMKRSTRVNKNRQQHNKLTAYLLYYAALGKYLHNLQRNPAPSFFKKE